MLFFRTPFQLVYFKPLISYYRTKTTRHHSDLKGVVSEKRVNASRFAPPALHDPSEVSFASRVLSPIEVSMTSLFNMNSYVESISDWSKFIATSRANPNVAYVVDFYSQHCPPCMKVMAPTFERWASQFTRRGKLYFLKCNTDTTVSNIYDSFLLLTR